MTGSEHAGDHAAVRQQLADARDKLADERDLLADQRELDQNTREAGLDIRERTLVLDEALLSAGSEQRLRTSHDAIRASREQLHRSWQRLDRTEAAMAREQAHGMREQGDIDREVELTERPDAEPSLSTAARWRKLSADFQRRADAVHGSAWDNPAPCAGWVARDVVGHMVAWMPALWLPAVGRDLPRLPDVAERPAGAWRALSAVVQDLLEDPEIARAPTRTRAGGMTLEQLVAMTGLMDVLVHTWDLARATGQDERLDQAEVEGFLQAIEPMDLALRQSGHYGPRQQVAPDADAQTQLLAFTGRLP